MNTTLSRRSASSDADRLAEVDVRAVEQDWPFFLSLLPADWEECARTSGAFQRRRGVPTPSAFLRLIFAYAYCGLSLRLTVFWAQLHRVADLSEVALFKRLRGARAWIAELLAALLARGAPLPQVAAPGVRVRVVDATTVRCPGSASTDYRLHVGFDLERLTINQVELTSVAGGETLKHLPGGPGEITLADRGYCHRQGIAALTAQRSWVLVRVNGGALPLQHPDGRPFDLCTAVETLAEAAIGEWLVQTAPAADAPAVPGRLIALRKSPAAAEEALRKLHADARRRGRTPTERSLLLTRYVIVFTTAPSPLLSAREILDLYRFRWQIELAFKRMKTHLALDELPAKDPDLCQTFLLTKLLAAVLVDALTHRWVDFSPWGYGSPAPAVVVAGLPCGGGQLASDGGRPPHPDGVVAGARSEPWAAGYAASST